MIKIRKKPNEWPKVLTKRKSESPARFDVEFRVENRGNTNYRENRAETLKFFTKN